MLDHIDGSVRRLLLTRVVRLTDQTRLSFCAPDGNEPPAREDAP